MRSYSLERGPGRPRTWCSSFPSCPCPSSSSPFFVLPLVLLPVFVRRRPRAGFLVLRLAPPGFTASPPADSARPRAGSGSTSSKPWGRGTLPAGEGPRRETQGEVLITVRRRAAGLRASLAVRNHSPTGPAGGYGGSGPTQLAPAILLAVTDEATAERFYQPFPWSVIAPIEADRWALDAGDVLGGLEVGGRLGRTTSCTWRWTKVVRAGCLGTPTHLPRRLYVHPCLCGRIRAQDAFANSLSPFAAQSACTRNARRLARIIQEGSGFGREARASAC